MDLIRKIYMGIVSIIYWGKIKLRYPQRVSLHMINSIRGKIFIEMQKKSSMKIGKFFMSRGPLYLKCMEEANLSIGNHVFFNHNCSITCALKIKISDECMIANNVVIVDHDHVVTENGAISKLVCEEVEIGKGVWIGANVTITKGVHIGDGAVVGANSVVLHDVDAYSVVAGVPAKKVK